MEIDLLVQVYIANEWCNDANCARILLTNDLVKQIFTLHKRAGKHNTTKTWEYSPELGNTEVDLNIFSYRNMADLSSMMGDSKIFKENPDCRIDAVELNVDSSHFWWSGRFKHSDIDWETRQIPLNFIPKEMRPKSRPKNISKLSDRQFQEILAISQSGAISTDPGSEIKKFTKDQLYQTIKKILTYKEQSI